MQMRMQLPASSRAVLISAGAVLLIGTPLLVLHEPGPLSRHMAVHIFSMNVVAAIAAVLMTNATRPRNASPQLMWWLAAAQMLLLWCLHAPRFHAASAHATVIGLAVHVALAGLAFAFWRALLSLKPSQQWHAPAALLLTGKLACLLAALLIFSPRLLYEAHAHGHPLSLADQQLAGLLMIVACPLSYLTAAVLMTLDLIGPRPGEKPARLTNETPHHAP